MLRIAVLALLAVLPAIGMAQTRLPVFLVAEIDARDVAGQKVLAETRDAIRASQRVRLVENQRQWPYLKVTIKATRTGGDATSTVHAVVYDSASMKMSGVLIAFGLNHCTVANADYCARNIVGDAEQAVDGLRRDAPELFATLR